jgi:hypothetical protein
MQLFLKKFLKQTGRAHIRYTLNNHINELHEHDKPTKLLQEVELCSEISNC